MGCVAVTVGRESRGDLQMEKILDTQFSAIFTNFPLLFQQPMFFTFSTIHRALLTSRPHFSHSATDDNQQRPLLIITSSLETKQSGFFDILSWFRSKRLFIPRPAKTLSNARDFSLRMGGKKNFLLSDAVGV